MAKTHHAIINALKHQLSTQRYEPSSAAHVVRKLLTAVVVAFGTTIPKSPFNYYVVGMLPIFELPDKRYLIVFI
jgi:hypothetical protein